MFVPHRIAARCTADHWNAEILFTERRAAALAILWAWKTALQARLAELRLTIHESRAQVTPTASGIPWLGFVVYPDYRQVKARKVRHATRRLGQRYDAYYAGGISFAEFNASVQGWLNHVRHADSWGLRRHLLASFLLKPGNLGRAKGGRV